MTNQELFLINACLEERGGLPEAKTVEQAYESLINVDDDNLEAWELYVGIEEEYIETKFSGLCKLIDDTDQYFGNDVTSDVIKDSIRCKEFKPMFDIINETIGTISFEQPNNPLTKQWEEMQKKLEYLVKTDE